MTWNLVWIWTKLSSICEETWCMEFPRESSSHLRPEWKQFSSYFCIFSFIVILEQRKGWFPLEIQILVEDKIQIDHHYGDLSFDRTYFLMLDWPTGRDSGRMSERLKHAAEGMSWFASHSVHKSNMNWKRVRSITIPAPLQPPFLAEGKTRTLLIPSTLRLDCVLDPVQV